MEHLDELLLSDIAKLVHAFEEGGLARFVKIVVLYDFPKVSDIDLHSEQSFLLIFIYLSMLLLPLSKGWGPFGGDILLLVSIIDLQAPTTWDGLFLQGLLGSGLQMKEGEGDYDGEYQCDGGFLVSHDINRIIMESILRSEKYA